MMETISPHALGATLYMPATRDDILPIIFARKIVGLRSLVVCLEDAVSEQDVEKALCNLQALLACIEQVGGRPSYGPLVFVRPRDVDMAARLIDWPLIKHVDGFVAPKFNLTNIKSWERAMTHPSLRLMPTLETADAFDPRAMAELKDALLGDLRHRIIALRIGGNDLMSCMGLRRNSKHTLYSGPMGYVIPMLAGIMGSAGFALTAPVFERMDNLKLLEEELELDIGNGLVGKTAIHPCQISTIHNALKVDIEDLNSARLILKDEAAAVFKHAGAMCEPATHREWAKNIISRAKWHGVHQATDGIAVDNIVRPASFA